MPSEREPTVYLTFDDGPHPRATPFVLEQLVRYEARATFFCLGKNVAAYPDIYDALLKEGHLAGNHTHDHLNGWATATEEYIADIGQAAQLVSTRLFRPPYGRIRPAQAALLKKQGYRIVMWSLLSGDFDRSLSPGRCLENVVFNLRPGDIVVFHDSDKAWDRMSYALPRVLEHCRQRNWQLKTI